MVLMPIASVTSVPSRVHRARTCTSTVCGLHGGVLRDVPSSAYISGWLHNNIGSFSPQLGFSQACSSLWTSFSCRPSSNRKRVVLRAKEDSNQHGSRSDLSDYIEVKVDSVRVASGSSVVFLRLLNTSENLVLQVHIGEHESSALLKEISKGRMLRPLTHDLTKNLLSAAGFRVTKIRITDIVSNTYYARVHIAHFNSMGLIDGDEIDVDARPSDAINLAARFDAPMYVHKRIADIATAVPTEVYSAAPQGSESHTEIVRSVKETLASFEDPTVFYQLQKELAVKDQRYEDAHALQQYIYHEMTHNQLLRLVVAMEAALSDGRYDEAARLRDEYRRVVSSQQVSNTTSEQKR